MRDGRRKKKKKKINTKKGEKRDGGMAGKRNRFSSRAEQPRDV